MTHGFDPLTAPRGPIARGLIPRVMVLGGLIAIAATMPAFAGLDVGLAAYDRGDYATAYRELEICTQAVLRRETK